MRPLPIALLLTFGAALPIPLGGALAHRVVAGLGFFVPTGTLVRARVPVPGTSLAVIGWYVADLRADGRATSVRMDRRSAGGVAMIDRSRKPPSVMLRVRGIGVAVIVSTWTSVRNFFRCSL